jgi:hypothetical protein
MKAFMFRPRATAAVLIALVLAACGGGGSSSSTSTIAATSQSASGTVTGFGSVYVDGVELEDAKAYTRVENADGSYSAVALQLGQRVRVAHDSSGTASTVTVDAALIGTVAAGSINTSALSFKVAGQSVKANIDSSAGQLTVYGGGYTAFSDIAAADLVEIHGSAVYDSTASVYVVQATRIEKKSAISSVRVMGKIANLDTTAKTFTINSLSVSYASATLAPSTATLANDQTVAVWGPSASLVSSGATLSLTASRVRVLNSSLADTITSGTTQLGGLVSNYSATTGSFELEGVKVVVGSATLTPTGASIGNGAYVQVTGTVGTDGSITATAIRVRQQSTSDDTASVRLTGAIESLTDQSSFVVRGVPVDAAALDVTAACPGVTLAVGTVVKVTATVQTGTDVVLATSLSCTSATTYTMRSLSGTAGTVDSTAKTFVLTTASATTQKVQWSEQTVFAGVTAATLDTVAVVVEGYLDASGTLVARKIRNPSVSSGRQDSDAYSTDDSGTTRSWSHYRSSRR